MRWFEGSVEQAIREKTSKNALLLVHIADDGNDSLAMDSVWEAVEISEVPIVALRLTAATQSFQQFVQFYPVVAIPSAYFIGLDGKVIEAVVGKKETNEVSQFVERAVLVFKGINTTVPVAAPPRQVSSPSANTRVSPARESPSPTVVAAASSNADESSQNAASSGPSLATIEERLARTRRIIEEREQERDREDEVRRRRHGLEMTKIREDMEAKQLEAEKAEKQKQKEADKIHKEKLLKQIEEDRAEKAARFNAERQRDREAADEKARAKAEEAAAATAKDQAARASIAKIQFRLPDGSSVVKQFAPSDKLKVVHDFSKTLLPSSRSWVTLTSITPRRTFSTTDMDLTLAELTLAPSASLLVLRADATGKPKPGNASNIGSNFFSTLFASFFGFVTMVWAWITGFIWGQPAIAGGNTNASSRSAASSSSASVKRTPPSSSKPGPSSSSSPSKDDRSAGKVYRLHDLKRDDDADKATWNGNSTNQM